MQNKTMNGVKISLAVMALASQSCWADTAAAAPFFRLGTGFDTSSGKYGTNTTTTISSIPLTANYDTGPWSFKLSVTYVRISGAGNVVAGVGAVKQTTQQSNTASGLGDVTAAATYSLYNDAASKVGVDVTAKVKFGTADRDKGLGTGKNDAGAQVDVYKRFDRWTAFAGLGYTVLGSSDAIPLKNVANATTGATYQLDEASSVGAAVDYRQKASTFGYAQRELTGFISHKFDQGWKGQLYAVKGFSDGSPDAGGGVTVSRAF